MATTASHPAEDAGDAEDAGGTGGTQGAGDAGGTRLARSALNLPPASFFLVSAIFHYLGPALAVLLFTHVAALGVMWLRVAAAAVAFALWRRPWRLVGRLDRDQRITLLALGIVLAAMNTLFYLAIARLPLATVGAIEFLGTVALAAAGARSRRNVAALAVTIAGVTALTVIQVAAQPLGIALAFGNCAGFMLYVVLGHRVANTAVAGSGGLAGIDQLGAAMLIGAVVATPAGLGAALPAFTHPAWLAWGIGVGLCSSVIPYVMDQLAMARLPRATFALMLALLPAFAAITGAVVLGQVPTLRELAGIGLVIIGVALHRADPGGRPGASERGPAKARGRAGVKSRAGARSKVVLALQVAQRGPAEGDREPERQQPEQQDRADRDPARHARRGEPRGQRRFHRAQAARGGDDRAERASGQVHDADLRDGHRTAE
jgi:inner membrane transporter RhtA